MFQICYQYINPIRLFAMSRSSTLDTVSVHRIYGLRHRIVFEYMDPPVIIVGKQSLLDHILCEISSLPFLHSILFLR